MLTRTLTIALLCATTITISFALEKPNLSRRMTITMPKSTTTSIGDKLYTVSLTKTNVHVNSSDEKPCDMTIDPVKDSIEGEMKIITSNDIIYILGEHNVERIDDKDRTKYTLLMINPHDCTVKSADITDVNIGITPTLPRLVINRMGSIDIYFPSLKNCAPCRFNKDGTKVQTPAQITSLETRNDGRIFSFDIREVGENYLYAQNMEDKKATMRIVNLKDTSSAIVIEKQFDYNVDAMTTTKTGAMGVCSKNHDRMMMDIVAFKEINCEMLNSKLEATSKIRIPMEPYSKPISRVSYDIVDGKTYIGFAEGQDLRVYIYDTATGQLLKSYDIGKIDERFEKYHRQPMFYMPYAHWNVRGLIVGREYCLVTEQVSDRDKHEIDLHDVRCIAMI